MKNNSTVVMLGAALAIVSIATPAYVQADWSGDIEGGTVLDGDSTGSKLRFKMSNSERPLNQQIYADWIRGEGGSNSYKVGYEPQYWFSPKTYVFGDASLLTAKDALIPIDQEQNLFAGLGIQLLETTTQSFFAEVGAGKTSTKFNTVGSPTLDANTKVARIGFSQVLTDFFKLELDGDYSTTDQIDRTTGEAGLSFRVPGGAIKYSYRVRSTEQAGQEAIDTKDSSVSFNYGF